MKRSAASATMPKRDDRSARLVTSFISRFYHSPPTLVASARRETTDLGSKLITPGIDRFRPSFYGRPIHHGCDEQIFGADEQDSGHGQSDQDVFGPDAMMQSGEGRMLGFSNSALPTCPGRLRAGAFSAVRRDTRCETTSARSRAGHPGLARRAAPLWCASPVRPRTRRSEDEA